MRTDEIIATLGTIGIRRTEITAQMLEIAHAFIETEREACARLCDEGVDWHPPPLQPVLVKETCHKLARDIRKRGETP